MGGGGGGGGGDGHNGPIRSESVGSCVVVPTTVMATFVLPTQCENKVQMK